MIALDLYSQDYRRGTFLPKKYLYFSLVSAYPSLALSFFCVMLCDQSSEAFSPFEISRCHDGSVLDIYWAFPYKKQHFVIQFDKHVLCLRKGIHGLPWASGYSHLNLSKIKSLYSNYKRKYVVALYDSDSSEKNALFVFDRYEDARVFTERRHHEKVGDLSEVDLKDFYLSDPFPWIESMDRPISLFAKIRTPHSSYELGSAWFWNFRCFLNHSFVKPSCSFLTDYGLIHCPFGFVHKDRFSRVVYCNR